MRKATNHLVKNSNSQDDTSPGEMGSIGSMGDDMKYLINSKADRNELETVKMLKSNKCDTEISFKWIEIIHKQLK